MTVSASGIGTVIMLVALFILMIYLSIQEYKEEKRWYNDK